MEAAERSQGPDEETQFHLVHAVRGRTRMRVDSPHQLDALVAAIEEFFRDHPGLQEIRANRDCQSVVVTYDPEVFGADALPGPTAREDTSWGFRVRGPLTLLNDLADRIAGAGRATARTVADSLPAWMPRPTWPAVLRLRAGR